MSGLDKIALMEARHIPIPVELDDERQSGIEADVVFAVGNQALGQLPSLGRPLEAMKHLLDLGDGFGRVLLVECADQLICNGQLVFLDLLSCSSSIFFFLFSPLLSFISRTTSPPLATHCFDLCEACRQGQLLDRVVGHFRLGYFF